MKNIKYILIVIIIIATFIPLKQVGAVASSNTNYQLLAPLPCTAGTVGCSTDGKLVSFDPTSNSSGNSKLGEYLNIMIKIFIGLCAVLSVVMIVMGGLEYMTSELVSSKEHGKERITHAILGLLLALGAYAILFTINPDLLNSDINPPPVSGTPSTPTAPASTVPPVLTVSTWYYEYKTRDISGNITGGPYIVGPLTQTECVNRTQTSPFSIIVRQCFASSTTPSPSS